MKAKLPIREKRLLDNGETQIQDSEIEVDIDTSLVSQMRFESKFPQLAQFEDIYHYSQRVFELKEQTAPVLLSKFKAFYCWVDTDKTFEEFVKMFSSEDKEYSDRLYKKMEMIVKAISDGATEKN